jgi:hypothetical protein
LQEAQRQDTADCCEHSSDTAKLNETKEQQQKHEDRVLLAGL